MSELTTEVHLALSGRLTFDQDISVAQAAKVISMLQAPSGPVPSDLGPQEPALPPSPDSAEPRLPEAPPAPEAPSRRRVAESPRQALELSGARTIPEKMTAFAAYLLHEEGREPFTQSDIRRLFQRARERIPTHFSRDFDRAVQSGLIHEGEIKDEYYISEAATGVIEGGFGDLREKRTRKRDGSGVAGPGGGRRGARTVPVPDAFAGLDHLPSAIEGVLPYHRVKLKRDKLLWALKLAKELGAPGLQNSEAAWLTDRLGDAITSRDMNGHYMGLYRAGYVNRSMTDNAMRITEHGEEYLVSLKAPTGS